MRIAVGRAGRVNTEAGWIMEVLHGLLQAQVGQEKMLSWVRWIVATVQWRKNIGEDHSGSEVEVGHPHELVFFAPRDKSDGLLNRVP